MRTEATAVAMLAMVLACESTTSHACRLREDAIMTLDVRDSVTGAQVDSGVALFLRAHGVSESSEHRVVYLYTYGTRPFYVTGSALTYDVRVVVPGYRDWTRTGIVVRAGKGGCGIKEIVPLNVRLQ